MIQELNALPENRRPLNRQQRPTCFESAPPPLKASWRIWFVSELQMDREHEGHP